MKRKNKKAKGNKEVIEDQYINIEDLIDDLAYKSKEQNIKKSKNFLDNMYLLNE